jgi:hypothetical protein
VGAVMFQQYLKPAQGCHIKFDNTLSLIGLSTNLEYLVIAFCVIFDLDHCADFGPVEPDAEIAFVVSFRNSFNSDAFNSF